jgi:dUTP pyrophosphatase
MGRERIINDIKKLKETISEITNLIPQSETSPETEKALKKFAKIKESVVYPNNQGEITKPKIQIKFLNKSTNTDPDYFHEGDSGFDFRANLNGEDRITINPHDRKLISTGLYFEVPRGYELQVRPRSGLALKHGITVLNTPGTVDSNYRGEVSIILVNLGNEPFTVVNGDRIAQGVVSPVLDKVWGELNKVSGLSSSNRESEGFGSTGIK